MQRPLTRLAVLPTGSSEKLIFRSSSPGSFDELEITMKNSNWPVLSLPHKDGLITSLTTQNTQSDQFEQTLQMTQEIDEGAYDPLFIPSLELFEEFNRTDQIDQTLQTTHRESKNNLESFFLYRLDSRPYPLEELLSIYNSIFRPFDLVNARSFNKHYVFKNV